MSLQTCISFSYVEHKRRYFEEPNSFWSPLTSTVGKEILWKTTVWSPAFFKISYFVFNIRKKLKQVWNDMRVSRWQNFHFWMNCPFNGNLSKMFVFLLAGTVLAGSVHTVVLMMPVPWVRMELAMWRMLMVFKCLLLLVLSMKIYKQ